MLKAIPLLAVLLFPYTLININAQEDVKVEIAEGADDVENKNFYVPSSITVPVGTTVVWVNNDDAPHTVTSGTPTCPGLCWGLDFNSGIMRLDDVYEFTFNEPGTYDYLCSLHPWMTGRVTVIGEGQEVPVQLSVKLDKRTYKIGDEVTIEGSISTLLEGVSLIVEVSDPTGEPLVSESIPVSSDGTFSYKLKLAGEQFILGSYTVQLSYADARAESTFVAVQTEVGAVATADVRVAAKQIRDLLLVRVTNADKSDASVYSITIGTSGSVIEAFKGPRSWNNDSVTPTEATSSAEDEPLNPGEKTYFKVKVTSDDFIINWTAFDSNHNIVDQGEAKPIRR